MKENLCELGNDCSDLAGRLVDDPDPFGGANAGQYDGGLHGQSLPGHHSDPGADPELRAEIGCRVCHSSNYGTVDTEPGGAVHRGPVRKHSIDSLGLQSAS